MNKRMANNADRDETAHYEPSHLDLRCLQRDERVNIKLLRNEIYRAKSCHDVTNNLYLHKLC